MQKTASPSSSSVNWSDYVVHLPTPAAFGERAAQKAALLRHVRYFLVVGSLGRPRRIATWASEEMGLTHIGSYFYYPDDPDVCDREFNIEVVSLGRTAKGHGDAGEEPVHVAIASHGIGASGAEIVLAELMALVHVARASLGESGPHAICGVGRCGTRGTIGAVNYGSVGISTASYDDALDVALPDPELLRCTVEAAAESGLDYTLGSGVSTQFFWHGQGRVFPAQRPLAPPHQARREAAAQDRLWRWVEKGITFVEMEDHAVNSVCRDLGIPSVTTGAVIARRYDPARGVFVLDYDADAKERSELLPARVVLAGFLKHVDALAARGGPDSLLAEVGGA